MSIFAAQSALILLFAIVLDALIGDPDWLWRRVPHPVSWMGRFIGWLDHKLNRGTERAKRIAGVASLITIAVTALAAGWMFHAIASSVDYGLLLETIAVAILLAQRSLYEHVRKVCDAFHHGGLAEARLAISMIVGRNPDALDEAGVCRAAIETTAENFSDGVVAPAFWYLLAGLPGLFLYKAVNTADSMIGHRTVKHEAFGWASARLDDAMNLLPARLSGFMIVAAAILTGDDARAALRVMWRDARKHRSPNAGWPEAATAGALGVALSGPRQYASGKADEPWLNCGGRKEAEPEDIRRSLKLLISACFVQFSTVATIALI